MERIDFESLRTLLNSKPTGREPIQRIAPDYSPSDLKKVLRLVGEKEGNGFFAIDADNKFAYENILKWCNADADFYAISPSERTTVKGSIAKGLYIAGPPGSGKTFLTNVFAKYLSLVGVRFISLGHTYPLSWETYDSSSLCKYYLQNGTLGGIYESPSLCIQDLGSEPKEQIYMGNKVNVIADLLRRRGESNSRITIITSNDRIVENKYGDRVTSRLFSMCNYYELKGKDRRKI